MAFIHSGEDMMIPLFKKIDPFKLCYLSNLAALFVFINVSLRVSLQIGFSADLSFSAMLIPALIKGIVNDCAALAFILLIPSTLILLPPDSFFRKTAGRIYALSIVFIFSLIFIFTAIAEYFFWDEFSSRFNFIAVDYLIYTTELIRNIVESYPLAWLLLAVFVLACASTVILWRRLRRLLPQAKPQSAKFVPTACIFINSSLRRRIGMLGGFYALAALVFFNFTPLGDNQNKFWNEYVKNGVYELFSAYFHNQLDYRAFYKTMDTREAFSLMQSEITDASYAFMPARGKNIFRVVAANLPAKKPNVIVVIMESMGSKGLGEYTPNLNALAASGLSFTNMMSTGTRTVRGLEAVMLSVPPTPGNSIVRRPGNDKLFNLGTPFKAKGYARDFIYGGFGYFDNMNAFFSSNGYNVTDRLDFAPQSKTFSNAWGQCDEDLYSESLRFADRNYMADKPFLQILLTTSNHRPFTFPDGKIDMESGSRRAAIKYADYAIGQFIREAKERPWFDNTVFIFVGDHPASVAGKSYLPANGYGIVCIMYGPNFIHPEKVETLCSQIDVAPTLLSSLEWAYSSQFFGTNVRELSKQAGRAWISTYQLLGFLTNDKLVVLKPDKTTEITDLYPVSPENSSNRLAEENDALVAKTVASYQCAYDLFTTGKMKEGVVIAWMPQLRQIGHNISWQHKTGGHTLRDSRNSTDSLYLHHMPQ
jgi:phosphoglycerol transferase MdoB-like AlkP superfamily enzyme